MTGDAGPDFVQASLCSQSSFPPPRVPFELVGNVPFGRTAAIVDWFLEARAMTAATLITQPEYAKKRTSGAGILRLARRPAPLISRGRLGPIAGWCWAGFSGVGGSLPASLRGQYPAAVLSAAFQAAGISPKTVVALASPPRWCSSSGCWTIAAEFLAASRQCLAGSAGPGIRARCPVTGEPVSAGNYLG